MSEVKIIGLCGAARSGKDTFFGFANSLLKDKKRKCERVAFADELKKDLEPFLFRKLKISAWTDDEEEKKLIRPILVAYGEAQREASQGMYWINKIKPKLEKNVRLNNLTVITDIRYENEIAFLKSFRGSKCIYVERMGVGPANPPEKQNDALLRRGAGELLKWRSFGGSEIRKCEPIVKSILKKFKII
jgi:hypothetical protein